MRFSAPFSWSFVACLAFSLMGCNSSLSYQNQFTIGPGDVKPLRVDAPRREQQVTVTFTSSAAPVDVYLALDKDLDNALIAIENYKKPEGILAKLEKSSNGSLQAVIPAKTAFGVIVAGSIRDTSVEVKITSK